MSNKWHYILAYSTFGVVIFIVAMVAFYSPISEPDVPVQSNNAPFSGNNHLNWSPTGPNTNQNQNGNQQQKNWNKPDQSSDSKKDQSSHKKSSNEQDDDLSSWTPPNGNKDHDQKKDNHKSASTMPPHPTGFPTEFPVHAPSVSPTPMNKMDNFTCVAAMIPAANMTGGHPGSSRNKRELAEGDMNQMPSSHSQGPMKMANRFMGNITLQQETDENGTAQMVVKGNITGLVPGQMYAVTLHEFGDMQGGCSALGPKFSKSKGGQMGGGPKGQAQSPNGQQVQNRTQVNGQDQSAQGPQNQQKPGGQNGQQNGQQNDPQSGQQNGRQNGQQTGPQNGQQNGQQSGQESLGHQGENPKSGPNQHSGDHMNYTQNEQMASGQQGGQSQQKQMGGFQNGQSSAKQQGLSQGNQNMWGDQSDGTSGGWMAVDKTPGGQPGKPSPTGQNMGARQSSQSMWGDQSDGTSGGWMAVDKTSGGQPGKPSQTGQNMTARQSGNWMDEEGNGGWKVQYNWTNSADQQNQLQEPQHQQERAKRSHSTQTTTSAPSTGRWGGDGEMPMKNDFKNHDGQLLGTTWSDGEGKMEFSFPMQKDPESPCSMSQVAGRAVAVKPAFYNPNYQPNKDGNGKSETTTKSSKSSKSKSSSTDKEEESPMWKMGEPACCGVFGRGPSKSK